MPPRLLSKRVAAIMEALEGGVFGCLVTERRGAKLLAKKREKLKKNRFGYANKIVTN